MKKIEIASKIITELQISEFMEDWGLKLSAKNQAIFDDYIERHNEKVKLLAIKIRNSI
jgi:hypothetical protein